MRPAPSTLILGTEALRHAAEWTGQPEGARALVESRRYLAMHELIERLRAELERAREVLRGVEWCELPHAYYGVAVRCPHCGGLRSDGHDPECPLSAALAVKGE